MTTKDKEQGLWDLHCKMWMYHDVMVEHHGKDDFFVERRTSNGVLIFPNPRYLSKELENKHKEELTNKWNSYEQSE